MTIKRVLIVGNNDVAIECTKALIGLRANIVGVVVDPHSSRDKVAKASLKDNATAMGLKVFQPENINDPNILREIQSLKPDIIFSIQYRQILRKEILSLPPVGCINIHFALLPKYRGMMPGAWAIINGETKSGVTIHYMTESMDNGDTIAQKVVPIDDTDTARSYYDKCTQASVELLKETYPSICDNTSPRIPQDESKATVYKTRRQEDNQIDWVRPATEIHNLVRGTTFPPFLGAFTTLNGKELGVCGTRVVPSAGDDGKPGEVVSVDGTGITVSTGKGCLIIGEFIVGGEAHPPAEFVKEGSILG